MFSLAFEDVLQKGVNVQNEEVLYNYTDASSMSKSKNGKPFRAAKEIHHVTLQALIEVCSQSKSLVADLSALLQNVGAIHESPFTRLVNSLLFHWSLFTTSSEFTQNLVKSLGV